MYLLVLVILSATIVVFFSQEFAGMFKRILAIRGFKLLLPLAVVSLIVEYYQDWGILLLLFYKDYLHIFMHYTAGLLPFETVAISVIHIVYLLLIPSLTMLVFYGWSWHKRRPKPWPHTHQLALILWIIAAVLLTVHAP